MRPIITLTTDFGNGSPYVAQMKGVILSLAPDVNLVDITHGIRPQNVREGALVLEDVTTRFPPGTLHLAVIDPGVGTARRLVYVAAGGHRYLAPDNGLLGLILRRDAAERAIVLQHERWWSPHVSATFHGRDILSPVAARLCLGLDPSELGPPAKDLMPLPWPEPERAENSITGEIVFVDSFGNLLTNIRVDNLPAGRDRLTIRCAGHTISGLGRTYGDAAPGILIALTDSQGRLEIAVVNGNAAERLKATAGTAVVVQCLLQ